MALLDGMFGQVPSYMQGLLGEEEFKALAENANQKAQLNTALALLQGGAPRATPTNLGAILGSALQTGQATYEDATAKSLGDISKTMQVKEMLRKQQIQQAQQKALQAATTGVQAAVTPEGQTLRDDQGNLTYGASEAKAVTTSFNPEIYKTYALRLGVDPKDIGATMEAMQGKTTTVKPGETVLGADMKPIYSSPRESNLQAVDTVQGVMLFNPVTGAMTPAKDSQGQPLMGDKGKAPLKFTEQVGNINNLKQSVKSYIQDIKDTDPRYIFPGSAKAAELQTKYSDLMMQMKDAYGLGALQAPDLQVMNKIITDPVSMAGRYKGKEALETQLNTIDSVFANREKNLYKTYQQKMPKELEAVKELQSPQEALGLKSIPKGVVINGVKY